MSNWDLKNKKALVTGGSKGIGKAIVKALAELGAEVLFTSRTEGDLLKTIKELQKQGLTVYALCGDVADSVHRLQLLDWVDNNWKRLDILINNAGINLRKSSNDYTSLEYQRVMDINLIAPFELSRIFYDHLEQNGNGAIVNVASVAGSFDVGTGSPYGMAKSGLIQLTKNLASEWAGAGIRVNVVSPWFTSTPLTKNLLSQPERYQHILKRTPLNRVASDYEIAAAITFLCMDKASYITGQNLSVDGGASISLF